MLQGKGPIKLPKVEINWTTSFAEALNSNFFFCSASNYKMSIRENFFSLPLESGGTEADVAAGKKDRREAKCGFCRDVSG